MDSPFFQPQEFFKTDENNTQEEPKIKLKSFWEPRTLVLGPGGIKALKVLGFLAPLEDVGFLDTIDTFCGVSVGALISLLLICGYEIREIIGEAMNLDVFEEFNGWEMVNILEHKGLISTEPIRKKLANLVLNKIGSIPTLQQLYLCTGKSLITVTLNTTDQTTVMMGPFTHPDTICVDAVLYSMNIPFLFYQIIYQGKTYIDGAFGNPYPVDYFDDGNTNILGIYIKNKIKTSFLNKKGVNPVIKKDTNIKNAFYNKIIKKLEDSTPTEIMEDIINKKENKDIGNISGQIQEYISKIIDSILEQRRIAIIQDTSNKCINIPIEADCIEPLGYTLSNSCKAGMLADGYKQGKHFIHTMFTEKDPENIVSSKIPQKLKYKYPTYYS